MKSDLIKIYFKGGALIPFYVCCFLTVAGFLIGANAVNFDFPRVWHSNLFYELSKLTLYSGLTSLCSATIFLNIYRKIATPFWSSFLSFTLLPWLFIVFVLTFVVDWSGPLLSAWYGVVFFLHFIGSIIGFQSFRATVILNPGSSEIMNEETPESRTAESFMQEFQRPPHSENEHENPETADR